ncbi:MAG TPA: PKD domain-containing protein [Candidatus Saccharimonadales bacterium]|nr:PKD domain-containing protein [Candidatus Saccharimonadales bacterium]
MRGPENRFNRKFLPAAVAAVAGSVAFALLYQEPTPVPTPAPSVETPTTKPDMPHPECSGIEVKANPADRQKFDFQLATQNLENATMWDMQDVEYDFGDGPSRYSNMIVAEHTYDNPGTYHVSAIIHMDSATGKPINKTNTVDCPSITVQVPAAN